MSLIPRPPGRSAPSPSFALLGDFLFHLRACLCLSVLELAQYGRTSWRRNLTVRDLLDSSRQTLEHKTEHVADVTRKWTTGMMKEEELKCENGVVAWTVGWRGREQRNGYLALAVRVSIMTRQTKTPTTPHPTNSHSHSPSP